MIVVGLMCGTSLDGIDAARVEVRPHREGFRVVTQAFVTVPLDDALRARLHAAFPPAALDALAFARLHAEVGDAFARAALAAGAGAADAIASHGITLAHDGAAHYTWQIGDPFRIREATDRTVIFDFRSADTAAGGEGAPLVPYVDHLLLGDAHETRVALNLGGIANLSVLPAGGAAGEVVAFDSGPANLPIDTYVRARSDGRMRFDRAGAFAAAGTVDAELLATLLDDPYLRAAPPKSTGRERFGAAFVARFGARLDALAFEDAVATLTALTVHTVADAVRAHAPAATALIVSGGGAHNLAMLDGLAALLPGVRVVRSDAFGIDPDAKEAVAFAVLGRAALAGHAAGLPRVTGARGPRVLGAIAPAGLAALLAMVGGEERER